MSGVQTNNEDGLFREFSKTSTHFRKKLVVEHFKTRFTYNPVTS